MKRGRGMSLTTMAKRAGLIRSTNVDPTRDYAADPQIGDIVEWQHNKSNQLVWLKGEVVSLVDAREDHNKHRPEKCAARRWRESKNWNGFKRVVVKIDKELPVYYTVTYHRSARNGFHIVLKKGEQTA